MTTPIGPQLPRDSDNLPWVKLGEIKIGDKSYIVEILILKEVEVDGAVEERPLEDLADRIQNCGDKQGALSMIELIASQQVKGSNSLPGRLTFFKGHVYRDRAVRGRNLAELPVGEKVIQIAQGIVSGSSEQTERLDKFRDQGALFEAFENRLFGGRTIKGWAGTRVHITPMPNGFDHLRKKYPVEKLNELLETVKTKTDYTETDPEWASLKDICQVLGIEKEDVSQERLQKAIEDILAQPAPPPAEPPPPKKGRLKRFGGWLTGLFKKS